MRGICVYETIAVIAIIDDYQAPSIGTVGTFNTANVVRLELRANTMKEDTTEITSFHAHVYFDTASRDAATRVRDFLGATFDVQLGRWHEKPIGPHPKAMYQVAFLPDQFSKVVPWLMLNREGLDILIHPNTGDDVKDHTDHSLWLGDKLKLNIEFLRQIRTS